MKNYRLLEIFPGLTHSFEARVTDSMVDQFRELCGDANPLHTEPEFASSCGYNDRVVYGMLTASFYSTLVGMYLPGRYALLREVDVSFVAPVFPGDILTVQGEVAAVHRGLKQVDIRAQITNQFGKKVCLARIRTGIHE